ncbi:MAG: 50S ribosomal protein L11 methyltransferase [Xanthobacteraceae bacterium]
MQLSEPRLAPDTMIAVLETDEQSARRIAGLFSESFGDDVAVSLADVGPGIWRVTLYFHRPVDEATVRDQAAIAGAPAAAALRFERIATKDWVAESLVGLKPVAAGRFIVHGAHDRAGIAPNRIGIEIEAALAFGTGHHGTTRGCLLALDRICKSLGCAKAAPRILDLGTGSGVLAIAAARALHRRVLATDIDAAAVHVAHANARLNRVGPLVTLATAAGVTAPAIRAQVPFDLVFANILLEPLQRLAVPLAKVVAPGGRVVLSGLLTAQANAALAAYHAFRLERRIVLDGWTALVLKRGR